MNIIGMLEINEKNPEFLNRETENIRKNQMETLGMKTAITKIKKVVVWAQQQNGKEMGKD
jgi:hypothetical protein